LIFLILILISAKLKNKINYSKIELSFIAFCLLFSYPFFFLIDRSNVVIIPFIYLFLAFLVFDKNRHMQAFFVGLAAATKIFPAVFLLKYLFNKEWKPFFIASTSIFFVTLISLAIFDGDIWTNTKTYLGLLSEHSKKITFTSGQPLWFSLDFFSFLQITNGILSNVINYDYNVLNNLWGTQITKVYWAISIPAFILGCNYVKNLDEFYQILYYMVSMIFIQPYSYAYHLIYLVIVFLYFVFKCDKFISKVFIFPIILLMIPKEYGLIDIGQAGIGKTQLSGLINPIIILFTYYSIFTLKEKK
jgi:hypothetical protein